MEEYIMNSPMIAIPMGGVDVVLDPMVTIIRNNSF
jgi:hypothetical protein